MLFVLLTGVSGALLGEQALPSRPAGPPARGPATRRAVVGSTLAAALLGLSDRSAALDSLFLDEKAARAPMDMSVLDELPPKAKQAYLQYLPQLQLDGDFYFFDLLPLLAEPGQWDRIAALTSSTDIGSAASVSRIEREFVTPMKILTLSFPPDIGGEDMQASLDKFQRSVFQLSRLARKGATTGNTALPSSKEVAEVYTAWDNGRVALNTFFAAVNEGTGSTRLIAIPPKGQEASYPRSKVLYTQLQKDAALCRNRGGEALAGLWGNLMVYGTVPGVNPCGNAAQAYYSQGL